MIYGIELNIYIRIYFKYSLEKALSFDEYIIFVYINGKYNFDNYISCSNIGYYWKNKDNIL